MFSHWYITFSLVWVTALWADPVNRVVILCIPYDAATEEINENMRKAGVQLIFQHGPHQQCYLYYDYDPHDLDIPMTVEITGLYVEEPQPYHVAFTQLPTLLDSQTRAYFTFKNFDSQVVRTFETLYKDGAFGTLSATQTPSKLENKKINTFDGKIADAIKFFNNSAQLADQMKNYLKSITGK